MPSLTSRRIRSDQLEGHGSSNVTEEGGDLVETRNKERRCGRQIREMDKELQMEK